MKRKVALTETATEDDLLVNLTFHDVPATLLAEFAQKIVRPYYNGNLNRALKELMEKAITEQQLLQNHIIKTT
jgi:tagatose-1,6-bisphosphate aldolase non-catalytic subunit AgaZ/GatZ